MSVQTAAVHQYDVFKARIHQLVDRATTKPNWLGRAIATTGDTIKAHPIAAAGFALGLGYASVRWVRR
jgi:hypothetical protein